MLTVTINLLNHSSVVLRGVKADSLDRWVATRVVRAHKDKGNDHIIIPFSAIATIDYAEES